MATPIPSEKREILACQAERVARSRQAGVDDLLLLLAWADAHSGDPQADPGAVPIKHGGPKLVQFGGDGTPEVNDLCCAELAIAREAGEIATQHAMADGLDLRHRLPRFWACVQELACEPWVARRVASLSRKLSREAVKHVDAEVAAVVESSPYRIIAAAEAAIIAADPDAHRQRIEDNERKRGVWLSEPRVGDSVDELDPTAGIRSVTGRLPEADAVEFYEAVEEVADALAAHGGYGDDQPTRDQLRADAMALLGRPEDALALLEGSSSLVSQDSRTSSSDHSCTSSSDDSCTSSSRDPRDEDPGVSRRHPRRKATLFAHLSLSDLLALRHSGLAKVDELGPMLVEQLARLLGHREVTITPVIDLHHTRAIDGYVHPDDVRLRTLLRTGGDVFPHATRRPGARVDHDHPTPYDADGPPGQTGDHNDAPLTRRHHRAKTHAGHRCDQLAPGAYRWITPHGLARMVTPCGTRKVEILTDADGQPCGEVHPHPPGVKVEIGAVLLGQ